MQRRPYRSRQSKLTYWRRRLVVVCILIIVTPFILAEAAALADRAIHPEPRARSWATNEFGAPYAPADKAWAPPTTRAKPKPKPKVKPAKAKPGAWPACKPKRRPKDIPANAFREYVRAGRCDWWVLAGVGFVESNHGQSNAPGVKSGVNRFGCCAGPMQFHMGGTAQQYGLDSRTVYQLKYAVPAAFRLLHDNGLGNRKLVGRCASTARRYKVPTGTANALYHYNRACWYVAGTLGPGLHYRYEAG
jgi:hypothetical protein